jgi:hypothetical protein
MPKPTDRAANQSFARLSEFDQAMRKLVKVPKEVVERREEKARTPRKRNR